MTIQLDKQAILGITRLAVEKRRGLPPCKLALIRKQPVRWPLEQRLTRRHRSALPKTASASCFSLPMLLLNDLRFSLILRVVIPSSSKPLARAASLRSDKLSTLRPRMTE